MTPPSRRSPGTPSGPRPRGPGDGAASAVLSQMVAIGLFFAFFGMALAYVGILTRPATDVGDVDLESKAANVLSVLTSSPGVPANWEENPSSMQRMGLLKEGTTITMSRAKLEALQPGAGVTYQDAREGLGLDRHQFRLTSEPKFDGEANRSTLEEYRLAYVGKFEGGESSTSETEARTLSNTSSSFDDALADEEGELPDPGDKFKDDTWYLQRHLIPRLAGLWYNDDEGSPSDTAWRVLDTHNHSQSLDPGHRNVLSTSTWDEGDSEWFFDDVEDDRIYAMKVDLSSYDDSDKVWLNFTHHANGNTVLGIPTDGGQVQTREVGDLTDSWSTENDGERFHDNGSIDDFDHSSVLIEDALGEESWIAFRWRTDATDSDNTGGWFISNWTLEGVKNGAPEDLGTRTLDYEHSLVDALVAGQGIEHGQFSENDESQDKSPIKQWIRAGGDVFGMAPENPSATQWLDPWIDSGGGVDHGPYTVDDDKSNTSHALLTKTSELDWRDWTYTDFHWDIPHTADFTWVLAGQEGNGGEVAPLLAVSDPDAPGDGNIVLSSQDSPALGETARQWYMENGLVTLRYRGLFLTLGDAPSAHHTVGTADTVGLVDATDGNLDHPNYEIFVDVWR